MLERLYFILGFSSFIAFLFLEVSILLLNRLRIYNNTINAKIIINQVILFYFEVIEIKDARHIYKPWNQCLDIFSCSAL